MEELFRKFNIGPVEIRNRIVMPPMITFLANENGAVSQRQIDYYTERAKGGVGLIIVEASYVREEDRDYGRIGIENPRFQVGLSELAQAIQEHRAKAFLQLNHRGKVLEITKGKGPDELTEREIETLIEAFTLAAVRAQKAGFDGVEIHGANYYLINQFLSPLTNHRQDQFGQNLEGRMRFATEILAQVRKKVGDEYPVLFRMVGHQYTPGGLVLDDALVIARQMEKTGASGLHIIANSRTAPYWHTPPMAIPRGVHVPLAAEIKKVVQIPVIVAGRINDPVLANQILKEGKADLIAMGRALIADPYLPIKARDGKTEEIRKCLACMYCRKRIYDLRTIRCAINAQVGREHETQIFPAHTSKQVLVIGGGPGGLEAARVLALRGHRVKLYEREKKLGGQVNLALMPPHKEELQNILDYFVPLMKQLGVAVSLKKAVTPKMIEKEKANVIVLATGALPLIPEIPGLDSQEVFTPAEVLQEKSPLLGKKIMVAGGGMVGCEVAEYLASQGKQVTIVEKLPEVGVGMEPFTRTLLIERLNKLAVKVLTGWEIASIQGREAILKKEGEEMAIEADAIVMALGARPNDSLEASLRSSGRTVYTIGDALEARDIAAAIHDGFRVAMQI